MELHPFDFALYIINIIVLFVIVRSLAYKPVRKFMLSREERIKNQLEEAETKKTDAETFKAEYENYLANAENDRQILINDGHNTAIAESHKIIDEAREEATRLIEQAREDAALQVSRAMNDAKTDVAEAAVEIASRVLCFNETARKNAMSMNTTLVGSSKGELRVANECDEEELQKIKVCLQNLTGHNLELTVSIDSDLIGGFVAYIDGQVYDFSYFAQLHDMRQKLS